MISIQRKKNHFMIKSYVNETQPFFYSIVSVILFIGTYILLFPTTGRMVGSLVTIPIIVIAWHYGTKLGVIAGISGSVFTFLLAGIFVPTEILYDPVGKFISALMGIAVGGGIGWLNSIRRNLKHEIASRQKLELELDQNELKFKTLITAMGEGLCVVDNEGILTFTNSAFERMLGYNPDELKGTPITKFLTIESVNFLKNLPELYYIKNYTNSVFELTFMRKDNNKVITKISLSTYSKTGQNVNGYFAVISDISLYKLNEQILTESRDYFVQQVTEHTQKLQDAQIKLEAIIETIPDGLVVLNNKGDILLGNNTFKHIYKENFNQELLDQLNVYDFPSHVITKTLKEIMIGSVEKDFVIEVKEGIHFRLQSVYIKSKDNHDYLGIIIQFQDISTYVEVDKYRKHIITTVSHELRTPLSVLSISANNLKKYGEKLTLTQRKSIIEGLVENATIMSTMIEDLLTLEKFSSKSLVYTYSKINITQVLSNVLLQLNPRIIEKNISISNQETKEFSLECDKVRIEQVFRIILDNAIKYSPINSRIGIFTEIRQCFDSFDHSQMNKDCIIITISDTGRGIPKEDLPFIFEKFYRSKEVENIQGTGIGLSLAKEIIEHHKGKISLLSELEKGTSVSIELPISRSGIK